MQEWKENFLYKCNRYKEFSKGIPFWERVVKAQKEMDNLYCAMTRYSWNMEMKMYYSVWGDLIYSVPHYWKKL